MMTSKQRDALSFFSNFVAKSNSDLVSLTGPGDIYSPTVDSLAKGELFSVFKEKHMEEAESVYNFLIARDSYDEFKTNVDYLPRVLNEGIYMYAVSVALQHRKDTTGVILPPPWEINPNSYFVRHTILTAKKAALVSKDADKPDTVDTTALFTTGTNRDTEFKMAWWREDIGLNGHHYHWHQVYPHKGIDGKTKDREGELFYYMHQQMVARYDADRLGVGLFRVEPYVNWNLPIAEGYNSDLTDYYGAQQYSARSSNVYLVDNVMVSEQQYQYRRLLDAVNTGKFIKNDDTMEKVVIDNLGAAVEASISSPNMNLYGSLHNNGHDILAHVMDPDGRYKMAGGVMGDNATAVRDPIFFRWHKFIDNLFVLHKLSLKPYTEVELAVDSLNIISLKVLVKSSDKPNILTTRMENKKVNIAHDMFLNPEGKQHTTVNVIVSQVNHDDFEYTIRIDCARKMKAAIRIFIAPVFDEDGCKYKLDMQRRLYIEMDKFVHSMTVGENKITRASTLSSVIKPTNMTYDQLAVKFGDAAKCDSTCPKDRYCQCGWPEHMLLPRGTGSGMKFDLFVMATDWGTDKVTDDLDKGTSYCGLKSEKYPDSRSMGFPFDRKFDPKSNCVCIADFATAFNNMCTIPITIKCK